MTFDTYDSELRRRVFQLPGQNKVYFDKDPQFGMWRVHFDKGGIPDYLEGQYTSFKELYDKTNAYLQTREKFKCSIGVELE